jgi:hypothetical protein
MPMPDDLTAGERKFLKAAKKWQQKEGAYAMIQGTRPQSLAIGLNDSPVGLAAWIVEKFCLRSDCDGDVEKRFTKDELLANVTLYWATETIYSSFLPYYDSMNAGALTWILEMIKGDRVDKGADGIRELSARSSSATARVGGAIFQYSALDGYAARRTFRSDGRTRAARRRHSRFLPAAQAGALDRRGIEVSHGLSAAARWPHATSTATVGRQGSARRIAIRPRNGTIRPRSASGRS